MIKNLGFCLTIAFWLCCFNISHAQSEAGKKLNQSPIFQNFIKDFGTFTQKTIDKIEPLSEVERITYWQNVEKNVTTYKLSRQNKEKFIMSLGFAGTNEYTNLLKQTQDAQNNVYSTYGEFKGLTKTEQDGIFNEAIEISLGSPAFGGGVKACIRKYYKLMMAEIDGGMDDASMFEQFVATVRRNCFGR